MPDETLDVGTAVVDQTTTADTGADQGHDDASQVPDQTADQGTDQGTQDQGTRDQQQQDQGKPEELAEFKGTVSARLKQLGKDAPELNAVLNKYPRVRDAIAAVFRREAAAREMFPGGLQEMQQLREYFPRGIDDVQQVLGQIDEVEALDSAFYNRDAQGNYPGHEGFIRNLLEQDREATIALLKRTPAEWQKLDPESYNQAYRGMIGNTFQQQGLYEEIAILKELAVELKNPELTQRINLLERWANNYKSQRPRELSDDERRFNAEREQFNRQKADRDREDGQRFHESFVAESVRFQRELIGKHQLIQNLPKSIPEAKKQRIVNEVRGRIIKHLDKIRPFKASFHAAYEKRDRAGVLKAQENYWTPWLVNQYVRKVLAEETPGMVASQAPPARRAAPAARQPNGEPTKNFKGKDGRWYRPSGEAFTTQEVLRGLHLQ